MKDRSQLYFITALIVSILLILSFVVRAFVWFPNYGEYVIPPFMYFLVPTILIWMGWYFEDHGFLLATSIILVFLFGIHLESSGVLNGVIPVISSRAPMVRTFYVLTFVLLVGSFGIGFATYFILNRNSHKQGQ